MGDDETKFMYKQRADKITTNLNEGKPIINLTYVLFRIVKHSDIAPYFVICDGPGWMVPYGALSHEIPVGSGGYPHNGPSASKYTS